MDYLLNNHLLYKTAKHYLRTILVLFRNNEMFPRLFVNNVWIIFKQSMDYLTNNIQGNVSGL